MKKIHEGVKNVLKNMESLEVKLILDGIILGIIIGFIIVIYKVITVRGLNVFKKLYMLSSNNIGKSTILFIILAILGYIVGRLVKKFPMISGSGIPQVEGILLRRLNINWIKVFIGKFIGGIICLSTGLSLGKEGPSVQMGAAIGQGYSEVLKRHDIEKNFLITSGAGAGLAVVFNAPLSGAIFALEEVHKSFSLLILLATLASSLTGIFIDNLLLGGEFCIKVPTISSVPIQYYGSLIILGILVGISGAIFNSGLLKTQDFYEKTLKKLPIEVKATIPFILTGIIGLILPDVLGGGDSLIVKLIDGKFAIKILLIYLVVKYLFTFFCYSSGVPGGIFFPLLAIGALVGNIFGIISCHVTSMSNIYIANFIILAMAGHFAAIVKAPITGLMLITEMTGTLNHLLPVTIVVTIAYLVSDLLGSDPIYESLLSRLLRRVGVGDIHSAHNKNVLEFVVERGSEADGKLVKSINWPDQCRIITIKRGDEFIIPDDKTKILANDILETIINQDKEVEDLDYISEKTEKREC